MVQETPDTRRTAGKSEAAFRTISEVADELDVPQHVLRFWETKFSQIRPMKRGGGRRYYRPEDVALLRRIRGLLYDDGFTIKGVQKLLREGGAKAVIAAPAAGEAMIGDAAQASHATQAPTGQASTGQAPAEAAEVPGRQVEMDLEPVVADTAADEAPAADLAKEAGFTEEEEAADDAVMPSPRGGDLLSVLEARARDGGLDDHTRAVVADVLEELVAVRDLLDRALQQTVHQ